MPKRRKGRYELSVHPTPLQAFGALASEYETIDVAGVSRVVADDCVIHEAASLPEIGGDWHGPQGFIDLMMAVQQAFSGFKFHMVEMAGTERILAFRGRLTAGLPAGSFDIPIVEFWTFENGKAIDILPVWHDVKLVSDLYHASYPEGRARVAATAV